jgi:hypothetical protein
MQICSNFMVDARASHRTNKHGPLLTEDFARMKVRGLVNVPYIVTVGLCETTTSTSIQTRWICDASYRHE